MPNEIKPTSRVGLEAQRLNVLVLNESRIGSIVAKMVPPPPPDSNKSVRAAMMQTVDSGRISLKASSKELGAA